MFYHSQIETILSYLICWKNTRNFNIFQRTENKITKVVFNVDYNLPTTGVYSQTKLFNEN